MAVQAAYPGYSSPTPDAVANFHGKQLVYIGWDGHLMFPFAAAFPLPPAMPFAAVSAELLPSVYSAHPDFARIDWSAVRWLRDGAPFTPDPAKTLEQNGIGHKCLLRLITPGLNGVGDTGF
ncbi:phenol hydroxylase [Janthinobacterium sp. BJB412]|nr:phenol hydroxylase [Janthinobacterium sp. BJB412]